MPPPWLAIIDGAIGLANMALARRRSRPAGEDHEPPTGMTAEAGPRTLETHMAGVVVAALREVFDRDSKRLELERELAEAERERAERALRLELRRQAGDREIGRLRLVAGLALVVWLATLVLSPRVVAGGLPARILLGSSWFCLAASIACALAALSNVGRALADPDHDHTPVPQPDTTGTLAAWFILMGLVLAGVAALVG
jgi:hypothetical protein